MLRMQSRALAAGSLPGGYSYGALRPSPSDRLSWQAFAVTYRLGAGACRWAVFCCVTFPIFVYLAFFMVGLPVAAILDDHVAHNIVLPAFFIGFGAWLLLPAIALLGGGLTVHYFSGRKASRSAQSLSLFD